MIFQHLEHRLRHLWVNRNFLQSRADHLRTNRRSAREFNRRLKRLFEEHGIARANPAAAPTIYLSEARPAPQPPSVTGPEPAPQA